MKFKALLRDFPIFVAAAVASLVFVILSFFMANIWLALAELCVLLVVVAVTVVYIEIFNRRKQKLLNQISAGLNFMGGNNSAAFPLPIAVCRNSGEIIWYNSIFERIAIGENPEGYYEISDALYRVGTDSILNASETGYIIDAADKHFTVYSHRARMGNEDVVVLYFTDSTKYIKLADEYVNTRPSILIMTIDNMSEIQQDYRESDCSAIRNGVEKIIETWLADYKCFIRKFSDAKFLVVAENRDLESMVERRFDLLDAVRSYTYEEKFVGVTLSIGVGTGNALPECEKNAKLALDMALGRGGDQAVVKNKDDYEFFGGVSKSVENTTKVKSRTVAAAMTELIQGCDNLFVMGHRFPDFDAMGAAIGVVRIAQAFEKPAFIATERKTSMALPLLEKADELFAGTVISIEEAKQKMAQGKKNLLVIVDTHITNFVESKEILDAADMVVVIDHHRKAVDYIKEAVIFFHDPSASSACEMVTELMEYVPTVDQVGSFVADALMSGIVLDTKNFILRAGSKTFEAAAFLKAQGAETVRVKKFFANDIESYHARNRIIGSARKYHNCAIAVNETDSANTRMISSQAADELLNISGVDASFVMFRMDNMVCISARSFGAVNVQVIMEYLGGGGHQTMAAVQLRGVDLQQAMEMLIRSINRYNEENMK